MRIFALVAAAVVVVDQATKLAVRAALELYEAVQAVPGLFNLVYYRNTGAAFGLFNKGGLAGKLFLIGVSVGALVVIGVLARSSKDRLYTVALSLIAGGAAGNLIDRAVEGSVVDFLDFYIGSYHWPAFNVADSAITAGVALAIISHFVHSKD